MLLYLWITASSAVGCLIGFYAGYSLALKHADKETSSLAVKAYIQGIEDAKTTIEIDSRIAELEIIKRKTERHCTK